MAEERHASGDCSHSHQLTSGAEPRTTRPHVSGRPRVRTECHSQQEPTLEDSCPQLAISLCTREGRGPQQSTNASQVGTNLRHQRSPFLRVREGVRCVMQAVSPQDVAVRPLLPNLQLLPGSSAVAWVLELCPRKAFSTSLFFLKPQDFQLTLALLSH